VNFDWTILLAIYGAVLATMVFSWDVIKYMREKPTLKVETHRCQISGLLNPTNNLPRVKIAISNTGKAPITVVASGFKLDTKSDQNTITVMDPFLPKELTQGQNHSTYVNPGEIVENTILYAWARNATGRVYRSKKHPFPS